MEKWKEYNNRAFDAGFALIEQLLGKEKSSLLKLYTADGDIELYCTRDVVTQLIQSFGGYVGNLRLSEELRNKKFHPDYPTDVIKYGASLIAELVGFTADEDLLEDLMKIAETCCFVFSYEVVK